jgi:hypothetical protein
MSTHKIVLSEEELDLILETLSFQFKYNFSNRVESLITKLDENREKVDSSSTDDSFEVYRTMVASTCHVEQEDLDKLAYFPEIFSLHDHHYGTRIHLREDLLEEIGKVSVSDGLKMLILFAVSNDCRYLELDSDGPEYDDFPRYEW